MWPFSCSVLVLDDDELFRVSIGLQLDDAGCSHRCAERVDQAADQLQADPTIGVILVDKPAVDVDTRSIVEMLESARPGVVVVGNSGADRREDYAEAGVPRFLHKPWQVHELVETLLQPIERCVTCSLALPLRRPLPAETGESWACSSCGARYRGILLPDAPDDLRRHVRRPR